ncbi:MAG TPA: YqaJ viral recombinase family protein [Leptospiraceae bacterium]|nr:YqaJ viral recombinase family protein [Leptospiraceae bacterium]
MFRKLDLDQGTEIWKTWRGSVITATAASIIMGLNPYANSEEHSAIYLLWAEKVGLLKKEFVENEAMAHGSRTEETARKAFTDATGIAMEPVCVVNSEYPFMAASLDGINEKYKIGLEIKCPLYYASFRKHKEEGLPDYYYSQVQHQLLVTGYSNWAFWSYYQNSDTLHIVKSDINFQTELLKRCKNLNKFIDLKVPPDESLFSKYDVSQILESYR